MKSIAIIGSHSDIGVLSGGGSAQVTPIGGAALVEGQPCPPCWARVVWIPSPPLAAIKKVATGATVTYNDGTDRTGAAALAASSDVAVVFVSQWESEGMDVPSLNFTDVIHASPIDQDALVFAVAAANPHTIVVMENGGPQLTPWINNVSAILEAWYPGQKGGDAIANILFGSVNPSGKLPMTFPASVSDLPRPTIATPPDSTTPFVVDYNIDGFNVGYKWYERKGITPLFPFGFGLSYTTFAITNAQLFYGGLDAPVGLFRAKFDLQNTGTRTGAEVVQIYLGLPAALGESKRLVAWQKATLTAGQSQSYTILGGPSRLLSSGFLLGALNKIVDRRFRHLHGIRRNIFGQRNCNRNLPGAVSKTFGEQKGRTICAPFSFGFVVPSPSSASSSVKSTGPSRTSTLSLRRSGKTRVFGFVAHFSAIQTHIERCLHALRFQIGQRFAVELRVNILGLRCQSKCAHCIFLPGGFGFLNEIGVHHVALIFFASLRGRKIH